MPGMQLVVDLDDRGSLAKVNAMRGGFGKLTRQVKGGAATIAAGTAKMQRGFGGLARTFSRVAMMGKLALAALAVATIIVGAKFEQSMANVASVAGATSAELVELSNTARDWGSRTAFSASEAAEGMYSLASAGQAVAEIKNTIGGVLMYAGAAATSLGEAAEATVQSLKMFGLAASETNRVVNVFAAGIANSMLTAERLKESLAAVGATASAMNMTLEETVGTLGLLHNAGMLGGVAGTRLKNVLSRLAGESGRVKALMGGMVFTGDNLAEVMQHLADTGATAGEIFGAFGRIAAPAVLTMMKAGKTEMDKMVTAVTGTQKAWEMYETQMNTVQSQFKIFKSAIQENMIAAFMALRPAIKGSVQYLITLAKQARPYVIGLAKTVSDFVTQNSALIKGWITTGTRVLVAGMALMVVAKTIIILKSLFIGLWGVMQVGVGTIKILWAVFTAFKTGVITGWLAAHAAAIGGWLILGVVVAAALAIIIALVIRHRDSIKKIFWTVANAFGAAWNWMADTAKTVGTAIKDAVRAPLDWILDKIRWLAEKAGWLMDQVIPGWREGLGFLLDVTKKKVGQISDAIVDSAKDSAAGMSEAFEYVKEAGGEMVADVGGKIDALKARVAGMLASLKAGGAGEIGMDIKVGEGPVDFGDYMNQYFGDKARANLRQYADDAMAAIGMISDYDRAQNLRTIAWVGAHKKAWLAANLAMINDDAQYRLDTETLSEEQKAQIKIEQSALVAEAKMEHEDAVLYHWMENNQVQLAALDALGAAYDTFFATILDKEMTGKKRREEMWASFRRSFIRSTAQMLKQWVAMELKNLLLVRTAKDKEALKEKYEAAKAGARNAFSAFASIPIIGPILGAVAAAAAFAFLMAFHSGGLIPGRRDNMAVNAQGGEYMVQRGAVTTATQPTLEYINATGRVPAAGPAVAPIQLNFNVSGGSQDPDALQKFIEDEIVPRIEDFQNRGGYRPGTEVALI